MKKQRHYTILAFAKKTVTIIGYKKKSRQNVPALLLYDESCFITMNLD